MNRRLKKILKGKVVIVGIGNTLRGDDAAGPVLVGRLDGRLPAVCIDAGSAPENYTGKIVREAPDTILLVDAVHLGKRPGEWDILRGSQIIASGMTTHDLSPKLFIEYLRKNTKARIYLLGVQPQGLELGTEISAAVKKTLDAWEEGLKACLPAGREH